MADNTKTLKMWQEAAAETKDCLPLETLEQMVDNTSRDGKPQRTWPAARTARRNWRC